MIEKLVLIKTKGNCCDCFFDTKDNEICDKIKSTCEQTFCYKLSDKELIDSLKKAGEILNAEPMPKGCRRVWSGILQRFITVDVK